MKTLVEIVKLFVQVTNNGKIHNWLKKEMTEADFIVIFNTLLIDLTLKPCSIKMIFKPCKQKLLPVKIYENCALTDNTRFPGPNIDGIIKNMNLDVSFLRFPAPSNSLTKNYNHYKGD